jgi:hypothetical protein
MEKFEKLHGHLEMVLLLAKIKKKAQKTAGHVLYQFVT